jgi:hypothetical protein
VKAAARGGNTLMNVGPMGDGRIDPKDVAILKGIGDWWEVNGDSIQGTTRTPLAVQTWGESTRKGNTLYLHVFEWPKERKLVVGGLKSRVRSARLLADSGDTIPIRLRPRALNTSDVVIEGLPGRARDKADTVIALQVTGEIVTDSARLLQPAYGVETLRVFDAKLNGGGIKFGPGKTRDAYAHEWTKPEQFITWAARLSQPANYEVELVYDAEAASAGGKFLLAFGPETLQGAVTAGTSVATSLGRVKLNPGAVTIKLSAQDIKGGEMMRPRSLILKTVAE